MTAKKAKIKPPRLRSRRTKPRKESPAFQFPPTVELDGEIQAISAKLRNAHTIAERAAAESLDIDLKTYFARLRKRRSNLIQRVRELRKEWAQRAKEEAESGPYTRVLMMTDSQGRPRDPDAIFSPNLSARTGLLSFLGGRWPDRPIVEGVVAPRFMIPRGNWVRKGHNSSIGIEHEDTLDTDGTVWTNVTLNDDAGYLRKDRPDMYSFTWEFIWYLPVQALDHVAICQFSTRQRIDFFNDADNYGHCESYIASTYTDVNGQFLTRWFRPPSPLFFDEKSGNADSGATGLEYAFRVRGGYMGKVALGHVVYLMAEDGRVQARMIIQVGESSTILGNSPPNLHYMMIPI